ncbi:MAG TPA: quinol:cytochrome C oxidoreductase [Ignavibacteria bacterium]|nr:quinol:cytochrome C oxidoreductase [Ignavibacteria bacterium]HRF64355.1 quinol:cytochrome C oxidoreductase [Ignavibacteria bacterium]HRJ03868.1 quinol:cytochrome C oxidoreductase [Ignavibacteria bacterium]HRJ84324.1 quinol:cytochrome C oxidoreductase [Ignavibacteria bacterium]
MDYIKKQLPDSLTKTGGILLAVGVMILGAAFVFTPQRAFFDYLWIYLFLVSIGVGSLALVALEYLVGATWSTPFRRITEIMASMTPVLVLLAIPLLFGLHDLFHWTHAEAVEGDAILQSKAPYLNVPFFIARTAFCLLLWVIFYFLLTRNSEKQDLDGDPKYTKRNVTLSTIFAALFVITITITAIDWAMSLEPHWFSTIFGVYYFAGTVIAALAASTFASIKLKEGGYLDSHLGDDSFYSLGTLMFGFNVFWAYIAFSQFILIWYADLPEETFWMIHRWEGNWKFVSLALLFFHFVLPFLILVGRNAKTNLGLLKWMAPWMLVAHALDLYWLIFPTLFKGNASFGWQELSFPLIVIGLTMIVFKMSANKKNLMAVKDPKMEMGLDFHL